MSTDLLELDLLEPAAATPAAAEPVQLQRIVDVPAAPAPAAPAAVVTTPAVTAPATAVAKPAATPTPGRLGTPGRRSGPTKKAVKEYRDSIFPAVESGKPIRRELIFDARLTEEICRQDFTTYRKRLQTKHSLDVVVPEMEKKAADLEKIAAEALPWLDRTYTGREWELLRASGTTLMPPPETIAARQSRANAQQAEHGAIQFLKDTCDPELNRQIGELQQTAQEIKNTMQKREKGILTIDARIARQRALVDAIIRGDDLVAIIGPKHDSRREENEKARAKLDMLLDQAAQKPQAEIDHAADKQRMAEIAAEIGKLEETKLDPRKMKWA
jgi:hypothetical protein